MTSYVPSALRRIVIQRAGDCCEYCRIGQKNGNFVFHIEHIRPEKHRGTTEETNLALSCPHCNSHKGSEVASFDPETDDLIPLFHPRRDVWEEHFRLEGAIIQPITPKGRVTEYVLRLNSPNQIERRELLIALDAYPCSSS